LRIKGLGVRSTPVLEVDGLDRRYGDVIALDGMTFTVEPGSVTGFLGPNGAGKTTTMRAVFGLTALDAGSVRFDGKPIDLEMRRRFGYLPEERGLYPTMRIAEQLSFLGALRGLDRKVADREARRWLTELGLGDRVDDELEDLSLGNQQRVQLISALLHEPAVLILDEPFSGLDPVAVDALSKVLVGEARRGATVLFSSHQLDLVEDLCERAIIVDRGRVVTAGTIDELTAGTDPVLEIDVPSDAEGGWTRDLGEAPVEVISVRNGRVRMTLRPGSGTAADRASVVLDTARRVGPVSHFAFDRRSLAEVFLALVGRPADQDTVDAPPEVADVRT
jgi:ABC-2 type transport system ATP-binding protein